MASTGIPLLAAVLLVSAACHSPANGQGGGDQRPVSDARARLRITEVASGLDHPWALAFLPDGGMLVTKRSGQLRKVSTGGKVSAPLAGVPPVWAQGQGGLLDIALAPDFATTQRVCISYAEPGENDTAGTAVACGKLGDAGLSQVQVIFRQQPKLDGGQHFGSRLVFDREGYLFITLGERNDRPRAQRLDGLQGKVVRLNADGSIPRDNPFVGRKGVRPEIWSYGHRNPQSATLDPRNGKLWTAEHGPRGGDEINRPEAGKNYGWPIITHGINYSGLKIPESVGKTAPGMEAPHHVWKKSPALSGMAFYTGHPDSSWNNSLFLGALAERNLIRLTLDGDRIVSEERLLTDRNERIRDVRVGPDGNVYVLTDEGDGKLIRLEPPRTIGSR